MKRTSPFAAIVASLILHAALITAVALGLSSHKNESTPPEPLTIRVMPAQPPAPATPPIAAPPSSVLPATEKKRQHAKPRAEAKPRPQSQAAESSPSHAPEVSFDAKPSSSTAAAETVAAPTAPTAPAKTSVSDANYASSNRKPPYPRLSQSNNEEGTVVLRVLVKANGTAGAVEIKTSSGYPLLDKSARTTVPTWRFTPATVNGKPVDEWYEVSIPFKLENN